MKNLLCAVFLVMLMATNAYCSEAMAVMLPPIVIVDGEVKNDLEPEKVEVKFGAVEISRIIIDKLVEKIAK